MSAPVDVSPFSPAALDAFMAWEWLGWPRAIHAANAELASLVQDVELTAARERIFTRFEPQWRAALRRDDIEPSDIDAYADKMRKQLGLS